MSLVNYYSSSDDENSNGDGETEVKFNVEDRSVDESTDMSMMTQESEKPETKPSLFSTLPAPKSSEIDEPEESDIKQFPVSAVGMSSTSRGLLNLPAPKKRPAQPIKITAPSLPETNSDDEEEEPSVKKVKPAKGLSGLFAMLPKPRNASLKETNRILLPHTLTKKPAPSKTVCHLAPKPAASHQPAAVKPKPAGLTASHGSDEDDEEEAGNASFFSFGESAKPTPNPAPTAVTKSEMTYLNTLNSKSTSFAAGPVVKEPVHQPVSQSVSTSQETTSPERPLQPDSNAPLSFGPSLSQDSPLAFKPMNPPSGQDAPLAFSKPMNSSTQYSYHTSQYSESQMYAAPYGYAEYNHPYQEEDPPAFGKEQGVGSGEAQGSGGASDLAADKEFQRLMGKRNVGREAINMVEIAADEQIGPTNHLDWMKKNLTEEKEYRAKLRKEQLPSGQQRRKHQITFLAHQAKERELELKNQWANNRQTRKDTQMKYGF